MTSASPEGRRPADRSSKHGRQEQPPRTAVARIRKGHRGERRPHKLESARRLWEHRPWLRAAAALVTIVAAIALFTTLVRSRRQVALLPPTPAPPSPPVASETLPPGDNASGPDAPGEEAFPAIVDKKRSYASPEAVEEAVKGDPAISKLREKYRATDVGRVQRSLQDYVLGQFPPKPGMRSPGECMNVVFRSVPRPTLPAYVERASYNGTPSWILVFVYAPDSTPESPLSDTLFYAMAQADCTILATAFWS